VRGIERYWCKTLCFIFFLLVVWSNQTSVEVGGWRSSWPSGVSALMACRPIGNDSSMRMNGPGDLTTFKCENVCEEL
jgi:hypothetical protein